MTKVRIFDPPNRLAKIVQGSEGVCFDELVAASEDRIELLKDQLQIYVRDQVRRVVWFGSLEEEIIFARCAELGQAAMNIADVAGAAQLEQLGEVAHGIRAMIDSLFCKGVWHTDALEAHITSLALLSHEPPPSAKEGDAILKRLARMRAAIGVIE